MSEIEPSPTNLEDGEIDEGTEPSSTTPPIGGEIHELPLFDTKPAIANAIDNDNISSNGETNDKTECNKLNNRSTMHPSTSSHEHHIDEEFDLDENEMLYVRGASPQARYNNTKLDVFNENELLCEHRASPMPYVIERRSYTRKSPIYDSDSINTDITPPKRRKTSKRNRRRKRTTPKKIVREKLLSDEETKSKKDNQSPKSQKGNLSQLCKFYLQGSCAKSRECEYMHSEFPCKFFYMGLPCEAEINNGTCKLSHGGPLSQDMLVALIRHIHTAPGDVLGENFLKFRSNLQVGQAIHMLRKVQEKLQSPTDNKSKTEPPTNFVKSFRDKLYFLSEEQIDKLQEFRISRPEDMLNLTLAQLNAIGIHAIQIEAIQMSLIAGQDIDMRSILPHYVTAAVDVVANAEDVHSREVMEERVFDSNWYEMEELPLIIDESVKEEKNEKNKEGDEEIDIVNIPPLEVCSDPLETTTDSAINLADPQLEATAANELATANFVEDESDVQGAHRHMNIDLPSTVAAKKVINTQLQPEIDDSDTLSQTEINESYTPPQKEEETTQIIDKREVLEIGNAEPQRHTSSQFSNEDKMSPQWSDEACNIDNVEEHTKTTKCLLPESLYEDKKSPQLRDESYTCNRERIKYPEDNVNIRRHTSRQMLNEDKKFPQWQHKSNRKCVMAQEDVTDLFVRRPSPAPISFRVGKQLSAPSWSPNKPTVDSDSSNYANQRKVQPVRPGINPFRCDDKAEDESWDSPEHSYQKPIENKSTSKDLKPSYPEHIPIINHKMQDDNSSEDWDADEQNETPTAPVKHNTTESISNEIPHKDSPNIDEIAVSINTVTCPADFPRQKPNLDNYKPALEINAHLTYPAMEYRLYQILLPHFEVNKPTHIEKLIKANSSDPRLKNFLEKEKNHGFLPQTEYSFFSAAENSQCDPRLRFVKTCPEQYYNASPILYGYLQRSLWYQGLKSNLKIQINHSVSALVRALNAFHNDRSPHKIFDFFKIECAGVLLEVMQSVGILVDVNGNIIENANYHQLCTPNIQLQSTSQQVCNTNENSCSASGQPLKPGLLGYAPPGIVYSRPPNTHHVNNENSFMRQAFGNDFVDCNNNGTPESGFYVQERNFNRNRNGSSGGVGGGEGCAGVPGVRGNHGNSDFEQSPYQRPPNRNFVRRM